MLRIVGISHSPVSNTFIFLALALFWPFLTYKQAKYSENLLGALKGLIWPFGVLTVLVISNSQDWAGYDEPAYLLPLFVSLAFISNFFALALGLRRRHRKNSQDGDE